MSERENNTTTSSRFNNNDDDDDTENNTHHDHHRHKKIHIRVKTLNNNTFEFHDVDVNDTVAVFQTMLKEKTGIGTSKFAFTSELNSKRRMCL